MAKFDIHTFVKTYKGPKLRLLLTGVGSYASGIIGIPGASAVIDSITIPYSKESVSLLLERFHPCPGEADDWGSVSAEMVVGLHLCNSRDLGGAIPLTVTGAITTNRYRRGENRAFIAFGQESVEVYHLQLDKLAQEEHTEEAATQKRYVQDRLVSEIALALGTGSQSDLVDELQKGGFLVRQS